MNLMNNGQMDHGNENHSLVCWDQDLNSGPPKYESSMLPLRHLARWEVLALLFFIISLYFYKFHNLLRSKEESNFTERRLCIPTVLSMRRDTKDRVMRKGLKKEAEEEGGVDDQSWYEKGKRL